MPRANPDHHRLFVALWPDPHTRTKITAAQQVVRQRTGLIDGAVASDNFHMTLAFLGDVAVSDVETLRSALRSIEVPAVTIELDRWGQFPRPGILWLGPTSPPDALLQLERQVCRACSEAVGSRRQKDFRPHVTLYRKVSGLMALQDPVSVEWPVDRVALVRSETHPQGVRYRLIDEVASG